MTGDGRPVEVASGSWRCPRCGRRFGRPGRPHMCAPQMSLDEFFDGRPGAQRAIHDAIAAHLAGLGPLIVEAVGIGILFKRSRTFAELRPRRDRLVLDFILPRQLDDPRVRRTIVMSASRSAHFVDLRDATDVDDQILGWLAEAYDSSPS